MPTTNTWEINWDRLRELAGVTYTYVPQATTNTYTYTTTTGGNWTYGANAGLATTNGDAYRVRRVDELYWPLDVFQDDHEAEEPRAGKKARKARRADVDEKDLPNFDESEFDQMLLAVPGDGQ
mgnify:CR=1 FL=1